MMATRTTTTRTTETELAQSADQLCLFDQPEKAHADFLFGDLVQAYYDCRKAKRNSNTALAFELSLERNLIRLHDELTAGTYTPGRSICFVITHPKPREVWAADFRDRIVHHLLYNRIAPRFHNSFIADSCACIPGRGTLYAATRLESKIRSITHNWSKPAFYLKCDLANFFVSIDKRILQQLIHAKVTEPWWRQLADLILFHDPRQHYELRCRANMLALVPPHKQLALQDPHYGLPIGNLSSQFFANIYLNELDQFIKHQLRVKHYIRYVDDFVLLHESPQQLNTWLQQINTFLPARLNAQLNPSKTILQPVDRGVDFVGQVIKPWHRTTRRRVVDHAERKIMSIDADELFETANSYFGLLRQSSHSFNDRKRLVQAVWQRGRAVNGSYTKTFKQRKRK
jgi:retron-type reverse transcriptase